MAQTEIHAWFSIWLFHKAQRNFHSFLLFEGQTAWAEGQGAWGSEQRGLLKISQPMAGGLELQMIFKVPSPPKPFYDSMMMILWFLSLLQFWAGYTLPSMAIKCSGSPVDWKSPWGISLSSCDWFLAVGALPALWEHCCQPGQALLPFPSTCLTPAPNYRCIGCGGWLKPSTHSLDFLKPLDYDREDRGPLPFWLCRCVLSL